MRPRFVVGTILSHDDQNKGNMDVRVEGDKTRYFYLVGVLRPWAAAAAAAVGSGDEQVCACACVC